MSYPRIGGVAVPMSLLAVGCPVARDPENLDEASAAAVAWTKRLWRKLPPRLLATSLPEPAMVLRTWTIGLRTRTALEHMINAPASRKACRVGDYVAASQIGPHGLVDLLAAREESPSPSAATRARLSAHPRTDPVRTPFGALDDPARAAEVAAIIRERLPLAASELGPALAAAGLARADLTLDDIVRAYRDRSIPAPFRLVRRGGAAVLVAPESVSSTEALLTDAAHFVFYWGLCTVAELVGRLHAFSMVPLGVDAAARILTTIPYFCWLDEPSGSFSFVGARSRLRDAIRKIFAVTERVKVADLTRALSKQVELLATIPKRAIEAYLRDVMGCEIADGWVRAGEPFPPAAFGAGERTLVNVLRRHGGELSRTALRQHAATVGLATETVRRLVRTSPLLLEDAGRLRLVGSYGPAFT